MSWYHKKIERINIEDDISSIYELNFFSARLDQYRMIFKESIVYDRYRLFDLLQISAFLTNLCDFALCALSKLVQFFWHSDIQNKLKERYRLFTYRIICFSWAHRFAIY